MEFQRISKNNYNCSRTSEHYVGWLCALPSFAALLVRCIGIMALQSFVLQSMVQPTVGFAPGSIPTIARGTFHCGKMVSVPSKDEEKIPRANFQSAAFFRKKKLQQQAFDSTCLSLSSDGDQDTNDIITVDTIRNLMVTNGDGCIWCWKTVKAWHDQVQELLSSSSFSSSSNNNDPSFDPTKDLIFVSIGDFDRLQLFLQKRPIVFPKFSKSQFVCDGFDFSTYDQAGWKKLVLEKSSKNDDGKPEKETTATTSKVRLGWKGWKSFLSTFLKLAPYTDDMTWSQKFNPPGLLRLGGTVILTDKEIVSRWEDTTSNDQPSPKDVLQVLDSFLLSSA